MGLISSRKRTEHREETSTPPAGQQVDSIIGIGTVVDGDCETPGGLRIDGRVTGSVRAGRLTISTEGWVTGDIDAPRNARADYVVRIDGRVDGTVTAPRVEIGPKGSVGSGLRVNEAVVRGRVVGAIVTEHRLQLEETAVVEGDVIAKRLGLAEGGQVYGTIRIGASPDAVDARAGRSGQASTDSTGPTDSTNATDSTDSTDATDATAGSAGATEEPAGDPPRDEAGASQPADEAAARADSG